MLLATTGCQSNAFNRLGFPPPVTKQGQVTLTLWRGSWIAAWIVGAVVWGLIVWVVLFHRKRSDPSSYGVNANCLEGFDTSTIPIRQADGVTMTVEGPNARDVWPGPRA